MEIKTDNKWRELKYRQEVPQNVLDDYDWLNDTEKELGWIQYKDRWYHLSDFTKFCDVENNPFPGNWNGYHLDSAFSGVLIKISYCGDGYKIGTYIS